MKQRWIEVGDDLLNLNMVTNISRYVYTECSHDDNKNRDIFTNVYVIRFNGSSFDMKFSDEGERDSVYESLKLELLKGSILEREV